VSAASLMVMYAVVPSSRTDRDHGGGVPVSRRGMGMQALTARSLAIQPDHVGFGGGLINEHQLFRIQLRLPLRPLTPCPGDVRPVLPAGAERLFLHFSPMSPKALWMVDRVHSSPSRSLVAVPGFALWGRSVIFQKRRGSKFAR
jgi:hypothetical protein